MTKKPLGRIIISPDVMISYDSYGQAINVTVGIEHAVTLLAPREMDPAEKTALLEGWRDTLIQALEECRSHLGLSAEDESEDGTVTPHAADSGMERQRQQSLIGKMAGDVRKESFLSIEKKLGCQRAHVVLGCERLMWFPEGIHEERGRVALGTIDVRAIETAASDSYSLKIKIKKNATPREAAADGEQHVNFRCSTAADAASWAAQIIAAKKEMRVQDLRTARTLRDRAWLNRNGVPCKPMTRASRASFSGAPLSATPQPAWGLATTESVSIPHCFFARSTSFPYRQNAFYVVKVRSMDWHVVRRYSEFLKLHEFLRDHGLSYDKVQFKDNPPKFILPAFPGKALFGNLDEAFVERRRIQLQDYLRSLVMYCEQFSPKNKVTKSGEAIRRFLEPDLPSDKNSSDSSQHDHEGEPRESLKRPLSPSTPTSQVSPLKKPRGEKSTDSDAEGDDDGRGDAEGAIPFVGVSPDDDDDEKNDDDAKKNERRRYCRRKGGKR
eukprot:Rmarinus@m.11249